MSEATTIDSLQIEIQTTSTGAAKGIEELAASLGKLKTNGSVGVAVKNLERLSEALKKLTPVTSNANKLSALATSMSELSKAGSIARVVNQLSALPAALRGLSGLNIDNSLGVKLQGLAAAMRPLADVKAGGIGTIASGLTKLQNIDLDSIQFDDTKIANFVAEVKKLDDAIGPLSTKMTTIGAAFKAVNTGAVAAGNGVKQFGSKVNATNFNLSNFINIAQGVKAALMPMVRLLSNVISEAIEWDGIAARFGRGFGDGAQEAYDWIQRLNEEMHINTQQFMQYSSIFSTMLQGFGVGFEDAGKMAMGYTELTYDIWAGYNDVYKNFADAADAVKSAIAGEVEPIRRAGFTIVESTLEQTAANHGLKISLQSATEAEKSYLRYLTLVDQAYAQNLVGTYASEMNTAEGAMRSFMGALKSLAQSLGSLFIPVLTKVIPWVVAFVEILTAAIRALAGFFGITIGGIDWGGVGGGGVSAMEGIGGAADSAADSLNDAAGAAGGAKKAVEDLKRATIGIDELNVISPPKENAGGGGGGGAGGFGGGGGGLSDLDIDSLWDDSIFGKIQTDVDKIKSFLVEALKSITAIISGFMLAIGTILVVTGANIPLGLALMAAGAIGLVAVIAANWNGMSEQLAKTLTTVTSVLGGFLLAIGAFLVFSGVNVGLGAALMVAGAMSLGTALTINWKFLEGEFKNVLSILTGIVAGGLLAMGALFAFTGVDIKLGVALMAAGAVGLATSAALNWDSLSEPMRKAIGTLEAVVGGGLLAVGAILTFTGTNLPLGIGLMAAGAVNLVAATALNWNSLTGEMKNRIATITTLVSGALLGVGAILAFSGHPPIGIPMMAAGAVGIIAAAPINWNWLTEKVKKVLKELGAAIGGAFLAVGALLFFTGVAAPLGASLMAVGAAGLVSSVALNWNYIVDKVKSVVKEIGIIAGASMLALGVLMLFCPATIPMGIALIAAGSASLVGGVALNWDTIVEKVKKALEKIETAWNKLVEKVEEFDLIEISVSLVKKGWSTIKGWIGSIPGVSQGVKLVKTGWATVKGWIGSIPTLSQGIKLVKSGWSTVKSWVGNIPILSQAIKLVKSGWSTVKAWIGTIPVISQGVQLVKTGWATVKGWIGNIPVLSAPIQLVRNGWSSVRDWLGNLNFGIGFSLPRIGVNWGSRTFLGFTISYPTGFYTYAKGGFPDFGELFVAREAGPEMVGKIGSKTTVANNEQIVEGISEGVYAAVLAAMRASEGNGSQSVNVYLDGRQITSAVERRQRERGASLVNNGILAY